MSLCQTPTGSCRHSLPDVVLGLLKEDGVIITGQQGSEGDGSTRGVLLAVLEGSQAGNNVDGDPGEDSRCVPSWEVICIKAAQMTAAVHTYAADLKV